MSMLAQLQKLKAQSVCSLNLPQEGCPPTPMYPELPSKLRMAHASFKHSNLERRNSLIIYEKVEFSIIMDIKGKDVPPLLEVL